MWGGCDKVTWQITVTSFFMKECCSEHSSCPGEKVLIKWIFTSSKHTMWKRSSSGSDNDRCSCLV